MQKYEFSGKLTGSDYFKTGFFRGTFFILGMVIILIGYYYFIHGEIPSILKFCLYFWLSIYIPAMLIVFFRKYPEIHYTVCEDKITFRKQTDEEEHYIEKSKIKNIIVSMDYIVINIKNILGQRPMAIKHDFFKDVREYDELIVFLKNNYSEFIKEKY